MKHLIKSILLFLIISILGCGSVQNQNQELTLKVLSYNVRNARGMDNVTNYSRVANVINRIDADCVALQELDSATERSNGVVVIEELAKHTNMFATYNKSIDYQGGGYGIGILTREKPLRKDAILLPGREEKRSLLMVEMPDYIIACTHWSLNEEDRLASVGVINKFFKDQHVQKPIFLAGDFNAVPESEEMLKLSEKWTILNDISQPTIPVNNPIRCIDYILSIKKPTFNINVLEAKVENETVASDHLPVWVKVSIQKQK